ncbi:MAG: iron uptake porin [Scytolyngbya sp. HA4215-MV1]|jgi:hypothetical protein|nr:iron uptake porin [Scytolyngbya sp. HA4215-MV1]
MTNIFWSSVFLSPIVLATTLLGSTTAIATEAQPDSDSEFSRAATLSLPTQLTHLKTAATPILLAGFPANRSIAPFSAASLSATSGEKDNQGTMGQVTSVSQLSDVQPTDWAFQALQSLVERYGCIAGYPDGTFKGNRALTRYEFAAGVNACLDRVNELIAAGTTGLATKEDLATLKKLQEEFAAELATLRGRVDALEVRTTELEKNQFSTTTTLNAEVIFAVAGVASGDTVNGNEVEKNTVLGDRVRLNFDTSFTGKDLLRTRLQASNLDPFSADATFTPQGDLRFAAGNDGNDISLDALLYQFPIGEKATVILEANAGAADDFTNTVNPFLDGDGGSGALTHFGSRNSIYYLLDGIGVGFKYQFSKSLELSLGYLTDDGNDPSTKKGLFNGSYGAIAQLTFTPGEQFAVGLTYIHSYKTDFLTNGSVGSNNANLSNLGLPFDNDAFGLEASFRISPKIVVNGSVGYTRASVLTGLEGDVDIWNYSVGLAFPDLFKKGSVGGIIVGMEPKVTNASSQLNFLEDDDTALHIEGFYQYQLTDNIAITPGLIWITAPDHNNNNDDLVIGTIRTTFTF